MANSAKAKVFVVNCFRCVKSMYNVVKAGVRDGGGHSRRAFIVLRGVKQGDVCSPILFSLFINELALDIINGGKHGAILTSTLVENIYTAVCG